MTIKGHKDVAVVIQDVNDYIQEAEQQLNNKEDYREVSYKPTETWEKLIDQTIDRFKRQQLLKENVADELKMENSRTSEFYTSPKINRKRYFCEFNQLSNIKSFRIRWLPFTTPCERNIFACGKHKRLL